MRGEIAKVCRWISYPLSPCGRGCLREAKAGERYLSADADPSSVADFAWPMQSIGVLLKNGGRRPPMATFSHKGRRKKARDSLLSRRGRQHLRQKLLALRPRARA